MHTSSDRVNHGLRRTVACGIGKLFLHFIHSWLPFEVSGTDHYLWEEEEG
jgi:hypothetical protein